MVQPVLEDMVHGSSSPASSAGSEAKLLPPGALSRPAAHPEFYAANSRRWWVCLVFSTLGLVSGASWNVYSPISTAVTAAYGWDDDVLAWLPALGGIALTVCVLPAAGLRSRTDLRFIALTAAALQLLCTGTRCIGFGSDVNRRRGAAFAMLCNGGGGALLQVFGPVVSAVWFPASERTRATAVMTLCSYSGVALGFLIGPAIVPTDGTAADIDRLYRVEVAAATIVAAAALTSFPKAPPTPPSRSASATKDTCPSLEDGLRDLVARRRYHWRFWTFAAAFGLPLGVFSGWLAVLGPNLTRHGFTQNGAGWLGFWITMTGCFTGMCVGSVLDTARLRRRKETVLAALYLAAAVGATVFAVACDGWLWGVGIDPWLAMSVSAVIAGACLNASIPIFIEICIEQTFPINEAAVVSVLLIGENTFQTVFLSTPFDLVGTSFMNWMLAAVVPLAIALLCSVHGQTKYARLDVDDNIFASRVANSNLLT